MNPRQVFDALTPEEQENFRVNVEAEWKEVADNFNKKRGTSVAPVDYYLDNVAEGLHTYGSVIAGAFLFGYTPQEYHYWLNIKARIDGLKNSNHE